MLSSVVSLSSCRDVSASDPVQDRAAVSVTDLDVQKAQDSFALGSATTIDGAVTRESESSQFVAGSSIYLSVKLEGSDEETMVKVRWLGPEGDLLKEETKRVNPNWMHFASFQSEADKGWKPGGYRTEIIIDDRLVATREFEILSL